MGVGEDDPREAAYSRRRAIWVAAVLGSPRWHASDQKINAEVSQESRRETEGGPGGVD